MACVEAVHPSDDVEAASWIAPRLQPFGQYILGSVIPAGFAAYARLLHEPLTGVLPEPRARALVDLLSRHTTTPDACWFCLWDGYGYLHPGGFAWMTATASKRPPRVPRVTLRWPRKPRRAYPERKRVQLPNRDYLLFTGKVTQAAGWQDGPNLWWPDDQAWIVASEIDLTSTFVAGGAALIQDILAGAEIGASAATPDESLGT